MIELDISVGRSRHEKNWKVAHYEWAQLVFKLSKTHRTAETIKDYLVATKDRKGEIKDIGGFVGGVINGGRRKKGSVLTRQLLTLDSDKGATAGFWDDFRIAYGCAGCIYSTHSHTLEDPHYRLIIPLDREVLTDEYEAIARQVAGSLDIEIFDPTTFQAERLMYWPSTSTDGVFEFQAQDGPALVADEVLARYRDWHDVSQWPVSEKFRNLLKSEIKQAEDPLEKPGVIGAFCRAYPIETVIDVFLPDVYTLLADGRYTYAHGSTAGGLVIYDDKFAYSHHGTDPAGGRLCNAFDLVRLHKFGPRDMNWEGEGYKSPSYDAMLAFCAKDKEVNTVMTKDSLARAVDEFGDPLPVEEIDWVNLIQRDNKGKIKNTINNLAVILRHDKAFKGVLAFDELQQLPVIVKDLPWRKWAYQERFLTDRDIDLIEHRIELGYEFQFSERKMQQAINVICEKTKFHPIRQYFDGLHWDGTSRVDSLLIDYMGVTDSAYTRAVTRKTLIAAVARVLDPGVKFDYVLTLIGPQGKKKSSLINALGQQWFSDTFSLHMLQSKEGFEQMRGVWIIEIAEMSGMAKAEIERIKSFVSSRIDRYRVAFGKLVSSFPRQCIFIGTANKMAFLRDPSGNRRFWPVVVDADQVTKDVFTDLTQSEVNQVWAEAVHRYYEGETLYLDGDLEDEARGMQTQHTEIHPWFPLIQEFLAVKLPEGWGKMNRWERLAFLQDEDELKKPGNVERDRVCLLEVWNEALLMKQTIDERNGQIIQNIMLNMPGWEPSKKAMRFGIYGRQRGGYERSGTGGGTDAAKGGTDFEQLDI